MGRTERSLEVNTIIRHACLTDIDFIIDLICEFHEESLQHYGFLMNRETLKQTVKGFIDKPDRVGLVVEYGDVIVGVMGGVIAPSIFDNQQIICQEAIWYIDKNHRGGSTGLKLLRRFEEESALKGAHMVAMIHMNNLNPEILSKFYHRNGYVSVETHYMKEL